jgi:hypothetical protein
MRDIKKTLAVLWEHRLALILLAVGISLLALSAGAGMYRAAMVRDVSHLQAGLNRELGVWSGKEIAPATLQGADEAATRRLANWALSGGTLIPSAPACRYVRQRSILGPPPRLATCSAAPVPAARSGIACETSITLMPAAGVAQAGRDGPACLVTTWARQQETWSMVTASLEWDTVSARPDGPGQDLDAAAGGGEVVRR